MKVARALREAAARLEKTSDTARLDAELLMVHALGVSRSEMLLRHMQDEAPSEAFEALVARREKREPVAYVTGHQEFYGLDLEVSPAVLIPRSDSETMIEAARKTCGDHPPARILDLGTGSGALLLAALTIWTEAEGIGLDSSPDALLIAMRNAQAHANTAIGIIGSTPVDRPPAKPDIGYARMVQRDWHKPGWAADLGQFDLILANPPYVEEGADLDPDVREYEPAAALFAGPDGLDDYRVLIPQLPGLLAEEGVAVLEIGATQAEAVAEIARAHGFTAMCHEDLGGRPRALVLTLGLGK